MKYGKLFRRFSIKHNLYIHILIAFFIVALLFKIHTIFEAIGGYLFIVQIGAILLGIMGAYLFKKKKYKVSKWWLFLPLGLLILTRIIPYFGNSVPLGQFSGVFVHVMENFSKGLLIKAPLLLSQFSPGFLGFSQIFLWLGMSPNSILIVIQLILEIILAAGIYLVGKRYIDHETGFFAVLLYAVSLVQIRLVFNNYFEALLGLIFAVFAIYFYKAHEFNRYHIPFLLLSILLGITHRPIFLVFIIGYFAYVITDFVRKKSPTKRFVKDLIRGVAVLLAGSAVYTLMFGEEFFTNLMGYTNMFVESYNLINISNFGLYSVILWPLAIMGFAYCIRKKRYNMLFMGLIVSVVLVLFGAPLYNSFLSILNIFLIIYSAIAVKIIVSNITHLRIWFLIALFGIMLLLVMDVSVNSRPGVDDEEMSYILTLGRTAPDAKIVVTDPYHYYWLMGYAKRQLISPEVVAEEMINKAEWEEFLRNRDVRTRSAILDRYEKPIYVYQGKNQEDLGFKGTRCFEEINRVTFRYKC